MGSRGRGAPLPNLKRASATATLDSRVTIAPRTPGSGRKKGTPNRKTVEMRALMAALVDDVDYQHRLREDFRKRRVHSTTEARVWETSSASHHVLRVSASRQGDGHATGRPRAQSIQRVIVDRFSRSERRMCVRTGMHVLRTSGGL